MRVTDVQNVCKTENGCVQGHSKVSESGVQNGEIGVLIPQSRDQSEDWRIAGVLKFEKAGKQNR